MVRPIQRYMYTHDDKAKTTNCAADLTRVFLIVACRLKLISHDTTAILTIPKNYLKEMAKRLCPFP